MIILVLPYFILLCHLWILSLRSLFLTNKRYNGSESKGKGRWEELGGIEGKDSVIRIYFMRKESNFNKRKKESNDSNAYM